MSVARRAASDLPSSVPLAAPQVLVADDDPSTLELIAVALGRKGYQATVRGTAAAALEAASQSEFDVVLTDVQLAGESGIELCRRIAQVRPDLPVIVMTAFGSLDTAVAAIRAGAYDFLTKPVELEALYVSLERALQHRALREEVRRLRRAVESPRGYGELLGRSPKMSAVYDMLDRVGSAETTVLITGESGTGKELVAHSLHQRSRPNGPFVVVNCAAIPEPLLESEFFGHVRGAYTDAKTARMGLFAKANGGTLFLDEIAELPLSMQPKLLRALQERKIRPVGEDVEVPFDARIIAATNRDLEQEVAHRRFREDLYFRINVIHVELPPLRDRGSDVLLLASSFLQLYADRLGKPVRALSQDAAQRLLSYPWPGNVRELQNCIEHAVALARGDEIREEELPQKIRGGPEILVAAETPSELIPLEEVEKRYILRVLDAVHGNKALAARVLHLDRTTLYRKLERYGVQRNRVAVSPR